MIPIGKLTDATNEGIPRESGDDPVQDEFTAVKTVYSPRERG